MGSEVKGPWDVYEVLRRLSSLSISVYNTAKPNEEHFLHLWDCQVFKYLTRHCHSLLYSATERALLK
jgi:hypothetical protein